MPVDPNNLETPEIKLEGRELQLENLSGTGLKKQTLRLVNMSLGVREVYREIAPEHTQDVHVS